MVLGPIFDLEGILSTSCAGIGSSNSIRCILVTSSSRMRVWSVNCYIKSHLVKKHFQSCTYCAPHCAKFFHCAAIAHRHLEDHSTQFRKDLPQILFNLLSSISNQAGIGPRVIRSVENTLRLTPAPQTPSPRRKQHRNGGGR